MHALGSYIQQRMEDLGLTQADLARRSGLSRQHISNLLDKRKTKLGSMVHERTIAGLHKAFSDPEAIIITKAAEAMGIPVDRLATVVITARDVSNRELIDILRERLEVAHGSEGDQKVLGPSPQSGRGATVRVHRTKRSGGRAGSNSPLSLGGTDDNDEVQHTPGGEAQPSQ